jgi:hypothetical protein
LHGKQKVSGSIPLVGSSMQRAEDLSRATIGTPGRSESGAGRAPARESFEAR